MILNPQTAPELRIDAIHDIVATLLVDSSDGCINRWSSVRLADLPTRRDALTKLEEHIRPVNQGTMRQEASMSFGVFAESQWSALVLPTPKLSTPGNVLVRIGGAARI